MENALAFDPSGSAGLPDRLQETHATTRAATLSDDHGWWQAGDEANEAVSSDTMTSETKTIRMQIPIRDGHMCCILDSL